MPRPLLIRHALVLDGVSENGAVADVRVRDGRIVAVEGSLTPGDEEVVDGDGLVLAPGFIDMHSHSDLYSLVHDQADSAPVGDRPKLLQGVTSQVFGQDGISAAPVRDDDVEAYGRYITGLDGYLEPREWTWRGFGEYLSTLRASSSTRVAGLVGHSTVRRLVMQMEARPPKEHELDAMRAAVDTAMREGAIGLSTGLVYAPAAYAGTDELVALCEVVAAHGGRLFIHVRSESDRVLEATEEALEVARRSGVHLHYSHIKTAGRANWHRAERMLEMIEEYRAAGVRVTTDVHPYTAGSTTATVLLPPWVLEGGMDRTLVRLSEPAVRERLYRQVTEDTTGWDNWWVFSGGWKGLRLAGLAPGSRNDHLRGKSMHDVIVAAGVSDPNSSWGFDVIWDLLIAERLQVSLISHNNTESNVARFMAQPYCSIGSDALVNSSGSPHPRLYGTFPRVLGRFVRELGVLSLPQAVRAMTGRAAGILGRPGLGRIVPGAAADLVLFDPDRIIDRATYEEPRVPPLGIERVVVAGRTVVREGRFTPDAAEPAGTEPAVSSAGSATTARQRRIGRAAGAAALLGGPRA